MPKMAPRREISHHILAKSKRLSELGFARYFIWETAMSDIKPSTVLVGAVVALIIGAAIIAVGLIFVDALVGYAQAPYRSCRGYC